VTHYWRHAAFLKEGRLLEDMGLLHAIPGTLIHGMHDVSSPPEVAREVNRRWAGSRLHLIADAGHGGGSMPNAIVSTLDGLRA
jgi:proline iminopeptidase